MILSHSLIWPNIERVTYSLYRQVYSIKNSKKKKTSLYQQQSYKILSHCLQAYSLNKITLIEREALRKITLVKTYVQQQSWLSHFLRHTCCRSSYSFSGPTGSKQQRYRSRCPSGHTPLETRRDRQIGRWWSHLKDSEYFQ